MIDPEFAEECLKYHNTLRALHNSPDLVIDIKLNDFAQEWADVIAAKDTLKHRQENDYGENLFVCAGEDSECDLEPRMPVQAWYDEISAYDFECEPTATGICKVGHFTQLVWRDSKKLGIGVAVSGSGKVYVVCNYDPPGNIAGEFADNVFPKKDDAGADSGVCDWTTDPGCTLDLNTADPCASRLKAIPEEELRVWSAWLTKVAEVAVGEWQQWLQEHIELAARINDQLLKARQQIEEEKARAAAAASVAASTVATTTIAEQSEAGDIETLEGTVNLSDAAAATHDNDDDVDKETVDDKEGAEEQEEEEAEEAASATTEKAEFRSMASIGIVPTTDDDILKGIPMPRDAEEMIRIARQFRRRAKKYQSLYAYWLAQADRVMEEICGKSTAEEVYTHEEIPSFFYLRDEADVDIRIDENDDDDDEDDDDVEMPSGPLERITYRGDLHLFFNLSDEVDDDIVVVGEEEEEGEDGEEAIFDELTED